MTKEHFPEKVLCDIDGVLADASAPILRAMNILLLTEHTQKDWDSWEWPINQLVSLADFDIPKAASWLFSTNHLSQAEPISDAQSVLKSWHEKGARIQVATSRPVDQADMTKDWLAQHYPFIHPDDIYIRTDRNISGSSFKQQVAEVFVPELYFEDEAKTILALLQVWPENLHSIIRLIDQPWNRSATELDTYRTQWKDFS